MKKDDRITDIEINLTNADVIIASDIHFPYQDDRAIKAFIDYVKEKQPEIVVLNGDVLDFYKLSRFSKDPAGKNPAEEIEMCREFLKEVRKAVPNSEIYYVIGNHETRLEKYVLDNAPQIACLVDNVFEIIKVDREDMCVKGCASLTVNDTFVFKHGTRLGNKSGLSAIKELEAHYLSGATGHCFSEDVEVITPNGWVKIIDVNKGDLVGTYNKKTKMFEYNKVNDKFVYENYKELYRIKSNCIDVMTTDKHGFIGYTPSGVYKEFTAEELSKMSRIRIPLACQSFTDLDINLSDDIIRLLVNISSDACIEDNSFRFHLKKERKIKHLRELLDNLGFRYYKHVQSCGATNIRISVEDSKPIIDKFFKNGKTLPVQLRDVDQHQARIILEEYAITDGCKNSDNVNSYQISSSKKEEIDLLQEIFSKNGMCSSYVERAKDRRNPSYVLTVDLRGETIIDKRNVSIVPYEGLVSCVSVNNGTLLVRSKGKTLVTQNTHRLARFSTRKSGRRFIWLETGCLCDLNPEYMVNADWEQGFAHIKFRKGKLYQAKAVQIDNGVVLE